MSHDDHDTRLTKMEATVSSLATNVEKLAGAIETDRERMWSAIEHARPKITWPVIVTTCGFLLCLGVALGSAMDMVTRLRIETVNARIEEQGRGLDRHERALEQRATEKFP